MIPAEVLELIPGCEQERPPLAVTRLPGGQGRNLVLRIDTSAGRFVLRRRLSPRDRPGAAALTELRAHLHAAAAGLAPAVLHAAADGGWILMEHVDAACWTEFELCCAQGAARLGLRLAQLHGLAVPDGVPAADPPAMAGGYLERTSQRDTALALELRPLADEVARLGHELAELGERRVLVHGDLMASNLLGPEPLMVDWEYAQAADPSWDLACLLSYYPRLEPFVGQLLGAAGCAGEATEARLPLQRARFTLLNRLWEAAYPFAG